MQDVIFVPQVDIHHQRKAILYSDARATLEANEVSNMAGGEEHLAYLTGAKQGATSLLAKLRWLDKHQPRAFDECQSVLIGGHDYVTWRLCHRCVTDATTASTTGLTDCFGQYAETLLQDLGLDHWRHKLPPITSVEVPCGRVSKEAAEELGDLNLQGIPVLHCCGDNGACSLGAGAGSLGALYAYLGTSGWVAGSFSRCLQKSKELLVPGVFTLAHPDPSLVFKTGSIMTAGGNIAWAASNLQKLGRSEKISWETVDQQAAQASLGSRGLLYLPYLNGERCPFEDPDARAAFIGISTLVSSAEMYRSVMEGVSFALLAASEAMISLPETGPLRLVGGGARSPIWSIILANIFGKTVDVLEDAQNVGVKGAAILAGKWLGWHDTLSPSGEWLRIKTSISPCPKSIEKYQELFGAYKTAYLGLQETFRLLAKYTEP
ncbi:hypothetical protein GOP47_0028052 [Adiantum capillus-veneris]|nr:hypothetical protein GOP47_0028052 [Adiantum capillus-veneris]